MVYAGRMFLLNVSKFLQPEYMTSHPSRLFFIVASVNCRYLDIGLVPQLLSRLFVNN